jgi:hypothetical protein
MTLYQLFCRSAAAKVFPLESVAYADTACSASLSVSHKWSVD